jgi:hypothetical protein
MHGSVLIQQASGLHAPMLELVASRHAGYCVRHGITYWPVLGAVQFSRTPHWNKIVLIRHALDMGFDTVAWLDADTLIVRDEEDFRTALHPDDGPIAVARHPGGGDARLHEHWNTGVMFLRNTPEVREFFRAVWELGPLGEKPTYEQARINDLLAQFPGLVQRLDDRWNSTERVNEAPEPVIKAWHGQGLGALHSIYQELKNSAVADEKFQAAAQRFVHEDNSVARTRRFLESIPEYPGGFSGRGIVICGGGMGYFTNAWVAVRQLRRLGCTLPVQNWHLGPREMDDTMRELMASLGVTCVDAMEVRLRHPSRILNGWELKCFALLHSPFREVLLLDADNVAVVNPEFLFDAPQFAGHGAIFWPDYGRMTPERSAWRVFDVPYRDEPEFESGQIVLDKARCWRALSLAMWFNEHSDFFYRHIWGDKDTFRFAWHRVGQCFAMPPFPIHTLEGTMCQHDFDGRRIFQHRNMKKWAFRRENARVPGFLFEQECLEDVALLKTLWNGEVQRKAVSPAPAVVSGQKETIDAVFD